MPDPIVAAVYARISLDRADRAGVDRQLKDCRALAKTHGWEVREYVDNDMSAYSKKRRPEWERLLIDLHDGTVQALVAYHPDRLYRKLADLERLVVVIEAHHAQVVTCAAGDIDLATASGRMVARMMGVFAQHESERTSERVKRMKKDKAAQGRPAGGGKRPFGLTDDRTALVPAEAIELRITAGNLLAGASMSSEARRLNAAGVRSTMGNEWSTAAVARVIRAPYIAGLRAHKGIVVGEATWPAIVDRDTFDRLATLVALRKRGRPPSDRFLLTGLLTCGLCGFPLYAKYTGNPTTPDYHCKSNPTTKGQGCGRTAIRVEAAEAHVAAQVEGWLDDPIARQEYDAFRRFGRTSAGRARAELDEIERRMVVLAEQWAANDLSDREHAAARKVLETRASQARAATMGEMRPARVVKASQVRRLWAAGTVPERRALLRELLRQPVVVGPGYADGHRVDVEHRMDVQPIWAS